MKQLWDEQELIKCWSLTDSEKQLLQQRIKQNRLGFSILLKFFQIEGRFPAFHKEIPKTAIKFLAEFLGITPELWINYTLKDRTGKRDREQIRTLLGFRPVTGEDSKQIQQRLQNEVVPNDLESRHLKVAVLDWCRLFKRTLSSASIDVENDGLIFFL